MNLIPPQQPGAIESFTIGCVLMALVAVMAFRTQHAWALFRQRLVSGGYTWDELEAMEREHYGDTDEDSTGIVLARDLAKRKYVLADEVEET